MVAEVEALSVYVNVFRDERTSLHFLDVAHGRYLTFGADLCGMSRSAFQRRVLRNDVSDKDVPAGLVDEGAWDFKRQMTGKELKHTAVRAKLRELQGACRAGE